MQAFSGEEDSGWMGEQEANIRRTDEMQLPKQLRKIRIKVGQNESGSFLTQCEFHGKNGTAVSQDFNRGWGNWKTTELVRGEQILGIVGDFYTNEDND